MCCTAPQCGRTICASFQYVFICAVGGDISCVGCTQLPRDNRHGGQKGLLTTHYSMLNCEPVNLCVIRLRLLRELIVTYFHTSLERSKRSRHYIANRFR